MPRYHQTLPIVVLLAMLGFAGCGDDGVSIEKQPLDHGEKIILKFDGPFSYSYQLKGKPASNFSSDTEDTIKLVNAHDATKFDATVIGKISMDGSTLKYTLGPDHNLKMGPDPLFTAKDDEDYKNNAEIQNLAKSTEVLDTTVPITFSSNLVGVTTLRKEKNCVTTKGEVVFDKGKTPNNYCGIGYDVKETGKMVQTDYALAEIQGALSGDKNRFVGSLGKDFTMEVELKNINAPSATKDVGADAGAVPEGAEPVVAANPASGTAANGGDAKSGCSLSAIARPASALQYVFYFLGFASLGFAISAFSPRMRRCPRRNRAPRTRD